MKKRYGYCICHSKVSSLNAKGLCPIGAKERHERSASSKGLTVKKKDDGTDNTRRLSSSTTRKEKRSFGQNDKGIKAKKATVDFKKTKIKPISKDKASELRALAEIKKRKISIQGKECELCGVSGEVDLFHIIGVGDKRFATDERNTMLSCREPCHNAWTNNDWSKIVKFKNFGDIMERLKSLDEGKYWKLKHKIDEYENGTK